MTSPTAVDRTDDITAANANDELQENSQEYDIESIAPGDAKLSDATTMECSEELAATSTSLPEYLVCPISGKLLQDPVVLSDGNSYDRKVAAEQLPNEPIVYPNRALKSILKELEAKKTSSLVLKPAKKCCSTQDPPLPRGLYCPITLGLMHRPVIDPQGYTYEKVAIVNWIRVNGDSPVTRKKLQVQDLVPNRALKQLLRAEANKDQGDVVHPAILKWKTERPPTITNEGDGPVTFPFPMTQAEWEAQLEQSQKQGWTRNKVMCWSIVFLLLVGLFVACFYVPILAAVLLFTIIAAIWIGMPDNIRSSKF